MDKFRDKSVLITGSCGTIGYELVRQLIKYNVRRIICLDNNETELFFQNEEFKDSNIVTCHLADVRDFDELNLRFNKVDIVLHTAALKHVGLCEDSPTQAVKTNIEGTQNVIDAALANSVSRVIFTSSDKAVNPTNVMGTSKLMGERLLTAANNTQSSSSISIDGKSPTIFASTRFGNVLGSRGSVIPLFEKQINSGGPITLTSSEMTRFVMSLEEASRLVLESVWLAQGGEVFVTKMPIAQIKDIANIMRKRLGPLVSEKLPDVVTIGTKPGEKLYEELMNDEEVRRTWDLGAFFVVISAFTDPSDYQYLLGCKRVDRPYHSGNEKSLTEAECEKYLADRGFV